MPSAKQIKAQKLFAKRVKRGDFRKAITKSKKAKLPSGEKSGNIKNFFVDRNGLVGVRKGWTRKGGTDNIYKKTYRPNREESDLWLRYVVKKGKMNVLRAGKIVSISSSHLIKRHPELT